jgi:cytochrome c oxidase subunit 2
MPRGCISPASSSKAISAARSSPTARSRCGRLASNIPFLPDCLLVPTDTPITFRATSPDVIHGFLIVGTNINTMLVPGYVANVRTRFSTPGEHLMPCHEFCGVGHEGMWARVKVIDKAEFTKLSAGKRRVSCAD